ncbi:unnamed protein product [Parajaminaea phylloscopi]
MAASSGPGTRGTRPSASSPLRFLLFSLVFHLLFTGSIFDIYFTSPVVHPERRYSIRDTYQDGADLAGQGGPPRAPADRLVLIVGDGLRADTLFKQHNGAMMPDWAARDMTAWSSDSKAYPWTSALQQSREGSVAVAAPEQLRRDAFFAAPHIRNAALHRGAWGISHTRVPTESRPGHVALIAGMYEDVSAVTKGWKLNPVNFDSLMNVSTHAYTFGSPDILPMFATGAQEGKVDMWSYDESAEDFTKDASHLDIWVLHRVRELFARAQGDAALDAQLRRHGNVFFLHLLGLDTTGHTYRPHSQEYVGNLIVVDAITRQVEALFEGFFGQDNSRTAWVFSADHGMSNKGNHGDGEPDNTRTPLVAWGSGLRQPRVIDETNDAHLQQSQAREVQRQADSYYQGWLDLDELWRQDVEQADVATLMATLLGAPLPANSEGSLPLDYLDVTPEQGARYMLANAMETLEIYRVKHQKRQGRMLRYVPFSGLSTGSHDAQLPGEGQVNEIKASIARGDYTQAVTASQDLVRLSLAGAKYLQTYDWLLLVTIVTIGYLGSIAHGIVFLVREYVLDDTESLNSRRSTGMFNLVSAGMLTVSPVLAGFYAKFAAERAPWTYYIYLTFAALLWARVIDERQVILIAYRKAIRPANNDVRPESGTENRRRQLLLRLGKLGVAVVIFLELMVFGYLERWAWTVGFFAIGFPWAFFALNDTQRSKNEGLMLLWSISCVASGLFTLGSTEKEESIALLILSGALFAAFGVTAVTKPVWFLSASPNKTARLQDGQLRRTKTVITAQIALVIITTAVTASSSYRLQRKLGLHIINQTFGWACLVAAPLLPLLYGAFRRDSGAPQPASHRLAMIILAFAPILILLSIRDEALFFLVYTLNLLVWSKMEGVLLEETSIEERRSVSASTTTEAMAPPEGAASASSASTKPNITALPRRIGLSEVRTSLFFLFFLHVGFFGTGNVASISSFYLSPVYRLVPIFDPFLMAALLIVKILVPFVILSSVVHLMCAGSPSKRALGLVGPGEEWDGEGEGDGDEDDGSTTAGDGKPRPARSRPSAVALELAGPPILGPRSIGGLGLVATPTPPGSGSGPGPSSSSRGASYPIVVAACILTDILALNFLYAVRTEGAWLEIGRTITHFAMANLLQVFMYALALLADVLYS